MNPKIAKAQEAYGAFLDKKIAPINRQYKLAILAATVVLPTLLVFFIFLRPMGKDIAKLAKDNRYLQGEIQKVEALAGKLDEHKAEMAKVELRLRAASLLLPKKKEIPSLLTNISEQGTGAGLEFISFRPNPEVAAEFYSIIPVSISVSGSYHKVGVFLDRISKLNRIVSVNNLSLGSAREKEGEMILTANLQLATYRFQDQDIAAKKGN